MEARTQELSADAIMTDIVPADDGLGFCRGMMVAILLYVLFAVSGVVALAAWGIHHHWR